MLIDWRGYIFVFKMWIKVRVLLYTCSHPEVSSYVTVTPVHSCPYCTNAVPDDVIITEVIQRESYKRLSNKYQTHNLCCHHCSKRSIIRMTLKLWKRLNRIFGITFIRLSVALASYKVVLNTEITGSTIAKHIFNLIDCIAIAIRFISYVSPISLQCLYNLILIWLRLSSDSDSVSIVIR